MNVIKTTASARRVYETLVKEYDKKPAGLEAKVRIAQLDFVGGNHQEAERRLAEVLKDNPRSADGLILQGKIALAKRNGKEAVQAFRTVLRDQPEQARIQSLLGQAHVITGEGLLGAGKFRASCLALPGIGGFNAWLLPCWTAKTDSYARARTRLRELVSTHPDHLPAIEMLFALDLMAGDWKQAKTTLSLLRSVVGESAMLFMAEGKLYEAQREFTKAEASFERAAAANPNAPEPLIAMIRLEVAQKQTDRARRRLETLVSMRPDHPYGHGLLGEILTLSGHQEEAVIHFREATRINPTWVTPWVSWVNLSIVRGQTGRGDPHLK